jgi:hypothetical protein
MTLLRRQPAPLARRTDRRRSARGAALAAAALLAVAGAFLASGDAQAKNPRVENLEKFLKDASEKVRIKAALSLGSIGDKDAVPALAALLAKDSVPAVRAAAAHALGQIGDMAAKPALSAATKDADSAVRVEASKALALLRVPAPTKLLKRSYFVVMGDVLNKTKAKSGPALVEHYKTFITDKLKGYGGDFFWAPTATTVDGLTFGGAIKKVAKSAVGGLTQIEVALSLVVTTNPGKKIVTIVDSEAGVGQEGTITASDEESMTREALEAALDDAFKGFLTALKHGER